MISCLLEFIANFSWAMVTENNVISYLLELIANFSWTMETDIASMLLFGEYEYPVDTEE